MFDDLFCILWKQKKTSLTTQFNIVSFKSLCKTLKKSKKQSCPKLQDMNKIVEKIKWFIYIYILLKADSIMTRILY